MVTDTPPRKTNSAGFLESDRIKTHWPDLREIERQAKSLGVLPQSFNGNFAQSGRRVRGSIRQEEALLAACGLHERRPNQVPRRWLDVSDTRTAATETLIESQPPLIGMPTRNRRDL